MSEILDAVLAANARYASNFGEKGELAAPPVRGLGILTCMSSGSARELPPSPMTAIAAGQRVSVSELSDADRLCTRGTIIAFVRFQEELKET